MTKAFVESGLQVRTVGIIDAALAFIVRPDDVMDVRERLALSPEEDYDAFFVAVRDGEYTEVWGMSGLVPFLKVPVYRIPLPRAGRGSVAA